MDVQCTVATSPHFKISMAAAMGSSSRRPQALRRGQPLPHALALLSSLLFVGSCRASVVLQVK